MHIAGPSAWGNRKSPQTELPEKEVHVFEMLWSDLSSVKRGSSWPRTSLRPFNLRHSEVLSATTKVFIIKSFRAFYLALSEAIQDINSGWNQRQVHSQ
jgi:hypothetical protein